MGVTFADVRYTVDDAAIADLGRKLEALASRVQSLFGGQARVRSTFDPAKVRALLESAGDRLTHELARRIADLAAEVAPVDTGLLRSTILVAPLATGDGHEVISDVHYAQWVEFGHTTSRGNFVPPNPYLRTALAIVSYEAEETAAAMGLKVAIRFL